MSYDSLGYELSHLVESRPHLRYAVDVINGIIPTGRLARLACERAIEDHLNPPNKTGNWIFDKRYPDAIIEFATYVPHITGEKADNKETFIFEPWQCFFIGEVFGWRDAENKNRRRFTEAILEIGKKNGKTSTAAILALYELLFGETGGELFSLATKKDQAKIVWEMAKKMVMAIYANPDTREIVEDVKITVKKMISPISEFSPLAKQTDSLDGPNPSYLIIDEAAAIKNRDAIEKMTSATAARLSPLTLYLTTPQTSTLTTYYEKREFLRNVLEKLLPAISGERLFGIIFAIDKTEEKEDDISDSSNWIKSNPNLDVSVRRDYLQGKVDEASFYPSKAPNIKMYHFGLWQTSESQWMSGNVWRDCTGEVQRTGACFIGCDLALSKDLIAVARIWPTTDEIYHVDFHAWTCSAYYDGLPDNLRPFYDAAIASDILSVVPGEVIGLDDYDDYVRKSCEDYEVEAISCDPYNATQLINQWEQEGLPVLVVPQSTVRLNDPSQQLESSLKKREIVFDGNPFVIWQAENCVAYRPSSNNLLKIKKPEKDESKKIDCIAALITGFAGVDMDKVVEDRFDIVVIQR